MKSNACHCWLTIALLALVSSATSAGISPRIVGGSDADPGDFPWQVALISDIDDPYQTQFCGAALIADRWILTAAHCFDREDPGVYVAVGLVDLDRAGDAVHAYSEQWIIHPDYDDDSLDNDIALIELETPLDLNACGENCAVIAPLTAPLEETTAYVGARARVSGWGNLAASGEEDSWTEELQFAELFIMACTETPSLYGEDDVTGNMFCAGVEEFDKDSCQGDSGGPIVVANNEGTGDLLAGIVSWGNGCAVNGYPGVYTRVSQYGEWLYDETGGACCELAPAGPGPEPDPEPAPEPEPESDPAPAPVPSEVSPADDNEQPAASAPVVSKSSGGGASWPLLLLLLLIRRVSARSIS